MIARQSVWSDPRVVELSQHFIPVADEVHRLQTGEDVECRLFQKIAEQGHYAGRTQPSSTRQGTYAAAPSGVLLASINSNNPAAMADMLERALAQWNTLSPEERLLPEGFLSDVPPIRRPERFYPEGGMVLRVNSRDLPRETPLTDWRARAWNWDYAWFTNEEARQFLPKAPQVEQKQEIPAQIIRRIARAHLVDNVRGQTAAYQEEDIHRAFLTSTVTAIEAGVVTLRLEGETRAEAAGKWLVRGLSDLGSPTEQTRGFEAKLLGTARYDLNQNRFIAFEMVAAGTRWGATQYNVRSDDTAPAPLGMVFSLAGDSPAERVAPAFYWVYGWK